MSSSDEEEDEGWIADRVLQGQSFGGRDVESSRSVSPRYLETMNARMGRVMHGGGNEEQLSFQATSKRWGDYLTDGSRSFSQGGELWMDDFGEATSF